MNLSFITRKSFPDKTPLEINKGECWLWALIAQELYPKELTMWSSVDHVFVKDEQGLCYDAEAPEGVKEQALLPFYMRNPITETRVQSLRHLQTTAPYDSVKVAAFRKRLHCTCSGQVR